MTLIIIVNHPDPVELYMCVPCCRLYQSHTLVALETSELFT